MDLYSGHKVTCVFLSGVKQEMLETIVPKGDSESIMVVLGEQRGQVSGASGCTGALPPPDCL